MPHLIIFGPGYSASCLGDRLAREAWQVTRIGRSLFENERTVRTALAAASHILSSVPPEGENDPVLLRYGDAIRGSAAQWIGYLSSTGVYGDTGGAWVDESAPVGAGRRRARTTADLAWQALHPAARIFRLPGIYGPGRSPLDRVREGRAHRIDLPGQVFSRVHVDDIAAGIVASMSEGPAGIYNLADDLPASQDEVIEAACALLGKPLPPLLALEEAGLSPASRAFYAENRRVANGKAKRLLGWRPRHRTYREGLRAILGAGS